MFAVAIGLAIVVLWVQKSNASSSASISHAYTTTSKITDGSIVSIDPRCSNCVQPANTSNGQLLLGIAVANNQSLLAVDPSSQPNSVQIATSGSANVLVSTLNGNVNVGDAISVSPFNGLGMKALPGFQTIGLAETAFSSHSPGATSQRIKGRNGKKTIIHIGFVRVGIAIGSSNGNVSNNTNLTGLQRLAKAITGNTVSTLRVVMGIAIAFIAILALAVSTYASVFGSIISVGRNPLAKYTIFRTLASVIGLAILTASLAGLIIFFLLK